MWKDNLFLVPCAGTTISRYRPEFSGVYFHFRFIRPSLFLFILFYFEDRVSSNFSFLSLLLSSLLPRASELILAITHPSIGTHTHTHTHTHPFYQRNNTLFWPTTTDGWWTVWLVQTPVRTHARTSLTYSWVFFSTGGLLLMTLLSWGSVVRTRFRPVDCALVNSLAKTCVKETTLFRKATVECRVKDWSGMSDRVKDCG